MATILRRRKLGMSSVKGICQESETGIQWCRNDLGIPKDDVYIRWGCTTALPPQTKVFNKAAAISQVNDKIGFRRSMMRAGLTHIMPITYFVVDFVPDYLLETKGVIVRPRTHAQGRNLHVCRTREELLLAARKYDEFYISELINKVAEYRVFVCQGRAVWVAQKTPGNPDDVAWNVAKGGRFDNVRWGDWPIDVVDAAIRAFNTTDLDFGGVDVMVDDNGCVYVIEINSAPSQTSPYRIKCVAKTFDYMLENPGRIPVYEGEGKYLKYIHPAVEPKAKLNVEEDVIIHEELDEVAEEYNPNEEVNPFAGFELEKDAVDRAVDSFMNLSNDLKVQFFQRIAL